MGIHPIFNPREVSEATQKIRAALAHMFPLSDVRIVTDDEIAIADNAGEEWQINIREPKP